MLTVGYGWLLVYSAKPSGHCIYRQFSGHCMYRQFSGHCMYRQFNIHKFYVLSSQCIYVVCVDLRTNSDYFPIQH
jgi:hypothetical protein